MWNYKISMKCVIVGDYSSGKTTLIETYRNQKFTPIISSTVGCSFTVIPNIKYSSIAIWDTAGGDRFRSLIRMYYRTADVIIIVFDCSDNGSLNNLLEWIENIDEPNATVIVAANKIDLIDTKFQEYLEICLRKLCSKLQIDHYVFVSSKEIRSVNKLFGELLPKVLIGKEKQVNKKNQKTLCLRIDTPDVGYNGLNSYGCCY